jgi:hypothetical protein
MAKEREKVEVVEYLEELIHAIIDAHSVTALEACLTKRSTDIETIEVCRGYSHCGCSRYCNFATFILSLIGK